MIRGVSSKHISQCLCTAYLEGVVMVDKGYLNFGSMLKAGVYNPKSCGPAPCENKSVTRQSLTKQCTAVVEK